MVKIKKESFFSKKNIVSWFIVFIMVFSILGFVMLQGEDNINRVKYKDIVFDNQNGLWVTTIDDIDYSFEYLPEDVSDISVEEEVLDILADKKEIDTTYDFNSEYSKGISLGQYRMMKNLEKKNVYVVRGTTNKTQYDLPVVRCENATSFIPVIYFKKSENTRVYVDNNCVVAEALSELDIVRVSNNLIYNYLGII